MRVLFSLTQTTQVPIKYYKDYYTTYFYTAHTAYKVNEIGLADWGVDSFQITFYFCKK